MTREQLKEYYRRNDLGKSILPQPWGVYNDTNVIRNALWREPVNVIVRYECFNDVEAELISEMLTTEERKRVQFTWLFKVGDEKTV